MSKKTVLLLNLGSPDSAKVPDVRRYLREFLSDPRVLDVNPLLRAIVLNLFILPFRPRKSAAAYATVWTGQGSPLVVTSKKQRDLLASKVDVPVHLAMRYGRPAVPEVMKQIVADGTEELFLVPLYPHYAMSSYETAVVQAMEEVARQKPSIKVTLLQPFYSDPEYIAALADAAAPHLRQDHDILVFSYHGVPERHLRKSDPSHAHCLTVPDCCHCAHPAHATCYRHQCVRTMELLIDRLGIPKEKTVLAFQSRLGRDPWLTPQTDVTVERLGREGKKRLLVICPSFVTDCLETLEEVADGCKETFEEAGGEHLELVPCLNENAKWIDFLAGRCRRWLNGES
ncbi:MAG: ferrochelatase [Chthoniobacterales bacterium]|nr:ferrochelatase [Chthoniobacterales bacterium]